MKLLNSVLNNRFLYYIIIQIQLTDSPILTTHILHNYDSKINVFIYLNQIYWLVSFQKKKMQYLLFQTLKQNHQRITGVFIWHQLCVVKHFLWLFIGSVTAGKGQCGSPCSLFLSLPLSLHFPLCALLRLSQESGPSTPVISYQPGERERKRDE